jgi:ribosomal protein S6
MPQRFFLPVKPRHPLRLDYMLANISAESKKIFQLMSAANFHHAVIRNIFRRQSNERLSGQPRIQAGVSKHRILNAEDYPV